MNLKIKDIPVNERPRERLINNGVEKLNNEELLALLLKTGTKTSSAKILASLIIKAVGDIKNLKYISYNELLKIKGIGSAKACDILASIELGNRINKEIISINNLKITSTDLVFKYYKDIIGDKKQEYFYCIYLDNNKKIIKDKLLFIGTINQSIVHPREVFKEAFILSASSIICVHNHPSGNLEPSLEDKALTSRLKEIGILHGIPLIDHVIVTKEKYYSFYENGNI